MAVPDSYIGRFAPTPSGPLHFGSIIAALASFLDARNNNGKWLLRIDDLDIPRVQQGASNSILNTLEILKLEWDEEIVYQNDRIDIYEKFLNKLSENGQLYQCYCPRKLTKGIPYPGTCRNTPPVHRNQYALRVKTNTQSIRLTDLVQGIYEQNLQKSTGDFIILRSDKIFAYNFATAIDDVLQGITDVIRGADLLDTTPKHLFLQSLLGLDSPKYGHVPVATDINGIKISKQTGAIDALVGNKPETVLTNALKFLGQSVDVAMERSDVDTILTWALEHWDITQVPKVTAINISETSLK